MFLIVGLGNIGKEYENTRHNIGFMILDKFCTKFNIDLNKSNSTSNYGMGFINGKKVICAKPTTYMNLSGGAILDLLNYYKINIENILVIYDDISLDLSKIRIREKGSHGGHNGIKDIINKLNTEKFKRIRVGIGENKNIELANYVLSKFKKDELELLEGKYEKIIESIEMIVGDEISKAMNIFN